jgi:hypothetical protein
MMTKGYWPGRLIVAHRVKSKHNLAAVLRPMALLAHVVFADVEGGKNRAPVGGKIEGKNTLRRIGRWSATLVNPGHLTFRSEKHHAAGRNEPTQSQ